MPDPAPGWAEWMRSAFDGLATVPGSEAGAMELARDLAEERAAILEYSGGLPRWKAEELAYSVHGLSKHGGKEK